MKIVLAKLEISSQNFMRICGYKEIRNPHQNEEVSYAKSIESGRFYPRFHIYLNQLPDGRLELSAHLDMKKPSYEGVSAHSGEYLGELVENEINRIKNISSAHVSKNLSNAPIGLSSKKSFWQKIFRK